jgi:uncharacterized membrane protein YsdA (DUF1294 family)
MTIWKILLIYLCAINLIAFVLYGRDKRKAERHEWRIPENTLLLFSALGGGIGSGLAMKIFHHKTRHRKFQFFVPFFTILWIIGLTYFTMHTKG